MPELTPIQEFVLAVNRAASSCTSYAETLQRYPEPVARLAQRDVIRLEYTMLFMTIGIREARKLRIPETTVKQLVLGCVDPLAGQIADPAHELTESGREAKFLEMRQTAFARAQALETIWQNTRAMDDASRFLVLFGAVSKAVLTVLKRQTDWEDKSIRDSLVGGAFEAWKSTLFVKVLRPLVPPAVTT
jgi:hypothetical protein